MRLTDKVPVLPSEIVPPPVKPAPDVTPNDEFAKLALVIPAEPDKLLFVKPEIVLLPAVIILLVNVSVVDLPT